jgi:hypothetical protein
VQLLGLVLLIRGLTLVLQPERSSPR